MSDLEALVKEAADAAIVAEMYYLGFDGSLASGFTGYSTLWEDAGLPQEEIHISYPDGRVTLLMMPDEDITPAPDGLRFDPLEVFQRWPEWMDLIFYPWYSMPSSGDFDDKVGRMKEIVGQLAGGGTSINGEGANVDIESTNTDVDSYINDINGKMSTLSGDAMEALKTSYLDRLPVVIGGQFALASVAGIGIAGEQELWKTAEADIKAIATKAKTAFEACSGGKGVSAFDLFTAAGVVLGIAGIFATGGTSVAVGLLSTAATVGTTYITDEPAPPEPVPFAADDPREVYSNIQKAVSTLGDQVMVDQENALRDAMAKALALSSSGSSVNNFEFGRPSDFLHEDRPGQLFGKHENIELSKDSLLDIAGRLQFVADHLQSTLGQLDGVYGDGPWTRHGTMGIGPEGHYFAWSQLVDQLGMLLDQARKALHAVAERMVLVAHDFESTEDQIVAELAGLVKNLPDPTPLSG